jgi:hypothetical protein
MMDAMEVLLAEGFSKGWLKDIGGLKPTKDAVRIRAKGGKLTRDGWTVHYASWSSVAFTTLISSTRARSYRWKPHSISATQG